MDLLPIILVVALYALPAILAFELFKYCYEWDPEEFDDPVYNAPNLIKSFCAVPIFNFIVLYSVLRHYIDIRKRKRAARKILKDILTGLKISPPGYERLKLEEKLKKIIKELKK